MFINIRVLTLFVLTFLGVCLFCDSSEAQRVAPTCHSFDGKTSEAALAYLKRERSILEPACICDAIKILDDNRYRTAIGILFAYLDFEKPEAPGAPHTPTMGPNSGSIPRR